MTEPQINSIIDEFQEHPVISKSQIHCKDLNYVLMFKHAGISYSFESSTKFRTWIKDYNKTQQTKRSRNK
ncbi:MAG: hypothetical protein H7A25_18470 [Leptospiraceae bacterium]|nr:hypothetical protein [Leptospiraceae bacterium]MCP5501892.1 hypothetical protein [Leptospiraceae bacterium]